MIFLDENGHDRLTLGESPNPEVKGKIGARTALAFGLLIHDQTGAERGGFAWLASGRAVIALDRPSQDGWTATVDDETGFAGMVALYSPDVAARNSSGIVIGTQGDSAFLRLKDTKDADRVLLVGVNDCLGHGACEAPESSSQLEAEPD
jgi:hypothetical protein